MEHREDKKLLLNNKGSITIEAVFVMPIIIGVCFSLLFISLYCFDHMYIECQLRSKVRGEESGKVIDGILGQGNIINNTKLDLFRSSYEVNYVIALRYPFTNEFIGQEYQNLKVKLNVCERNSCDFVRKYDSLVRKR